MLPADGQRPQSDDAHDMPGRRGDRNTGIFVLDKVRSVIDDAFDELRTEHVQQNERQPDGDGLDVVAFERPEAGKQAADEGPLNRAIALFVVAFHRSGGDGSGPGRNSRRRVHRLARLLSTVIASYLFRRGDFFVPLRRLNRHLPQALHMRRILRGIGNQLVAVKLGGGDFAVVAVLRHQLLVRARSG